MSEVLLNSTVAVPLTSSVVATEVSPSVDGFSQILNQLTGTPQAQVTSTISATGLPTQNGQSTTLPLALPTELIQTLQKLLPESMQTGNGITSTDGSATLQVITGEKAEILTTAGNQDNPVELSAEAIYQMMESLAATLGTPAFQPVQDPDFENLNGEINGSSVIPETLNSIVSSTTEQPVSQKLGAIIAELLSRPNDEIIQSQPTVISGETPILSGQNLGESEIPNQILQSQSQSVVLSTPQSLNQVLQSQPSDISGETSVESLAQVDEQSGVIEVQTKAQETKGFDGSVIIDNPASVTTVAGVSVETVIPVEQRKFGLRGTAKVNGKEGESQNLINGKALIIQPQIQATADDSQINSITGLSGGDSEATTDSKQQHIVMVDSAILETGSSLEKSSTSEMNLTPQMAASSFSSCLEQVEKTVTEGTDAAPVKKEAVFSQIVEKAKILVNNGNSEMELQLKPDSLGKIQLRISMENQLVSAKFVAESEQVKALIETNLTDLKQTLSQNGVQVDLLEVSVGQQNSNGQNQNGNPFQGSWQSAFATKRRFSEPAEVEIGYSGSPEPVHGNMRIDLIA